jgi:broad specificity phosphatase PhoE
MKSTRWLRLTRESARESTFTAASVFSIVVAAWLASAAPVAVAAPSLQIWFVSHAESEINVATRPHTVPDGGVSYPLTQTGVEQATALAQAMASAPITTIYSSTYLRAIQTADAIAFRHGLTLSLAPEAIEIDLGLKRDSEDVREVYGELARKWVLDKDLAFRHGEGESFIDAQRRFLPFVRELMNRHADDTGVVVVVSHGALLAFMVPVLANNVPADFATRHPLTNTSIIKTELRDGRLVCTEWVGIGSADFAR